ncbi:MAG: sugar phosphate isomerase/epimerase [bacterium]|nr:sugar phosphate isomerase/epimerase [bacterium]
MKISMNEMTTYRWSFEEDVARYAEAGFDGIGIWRQKLADFGEEKGVELVRDSGLDVASLHWVGGFTGSEGRSFEESVEDAFDCLELANQLGAGCVVAYTGARGGHTRNHARRLATDAFVSISRHAESLGLTIAIEPMHADCGSEWTFLNSLEDTLQLLGEVGEDSLKIVCDAYHLTFEPDSLDLIGSVADRIGLVQLGDAARAPIGEQNRCRIGEGDLPLAELVEMLQKAGYQGVYEIELLGEDVEEFDYAELITHSKAAALRLA